MELTPRKQAILKAIVKAYIETGEPVGSKNLTALLENAPSPATIRNEMSDLCELGFLTQPHTSAGRVPTPSGYRLYVDSLSPRHAPTAEDAEYIRSYLEKLSCEPEAVPTYAAQLLQKLTGLATIACIVNDSPVKIKTVELIKIGKSSFMILLVTKDGRTRNRVFRQSAPISFEARAVFDELVEHNIQGSRACDLTLAYMQSLLAKTGIYAFELMPLLSAVFELASGLENSEIVLKGEKALYNVFGDGAAARKIMSLIKIRDPILKILGGIDKKAGVVFGTDMGYKEVQSGTVVAARFGDAKLKGYLGVIGPDRIAYEQIMPFVEYTAEICTKIMTQAQHDMED